MSEAVRHLLELFDELTQDDQRRVVDELLAREPTSGLPRVPYGEGAVPPKGLDALAGELFTNLDAEENARAADR